MMSKLEWKVVDNRLRGGDDPIEKIEPELVAGKTVHVKGVNNSDLSSWYSRFKNRHDLLLRRRLSGKDESEGYYVWLVRPGEE